jgi:NADPH-dependent glutamate synthase beta subunit-like oxidoreductase
MMKPTMPRPTAHRTPHTHHAWKGSWSSGRVGAGTSLELVHVYVPVVVKPTAVGVHVLVNVVVGGGTVVQAIAEGKIATKGIDEYLKGRSR